MSAPVVLSCAVAALILGAPVVAAGAHLEARHRVSGAADASALAASDALSGLVDADPCRLAEQTAEAFRAQLADCVTDGVTGEARTVVSVGTPMGTVSARARAAPPFPPIRTAAGAVGAVEANGWAWPSEVRGITQDLHDGTSIDLAAPVGSWLFTPYDGVIVQAGADGGGMPAPCVANPSWWQGPNHSVMIRHVYDGRVLYSSHNHVEPGSPAHLGLSPGDRVVAGQPVAVAGMSGCTSGPHSHFTLSTRPGNAFPNVDPFEFLGRP